MIMVGLAVEVVVEAVDVVVVDVDVVLVVKLFCCFFVVVGACDVAVGRVVRVVLNVLVVLVVVVDVVVVDVDVVLVVKLFNCSLPGGKVGEIRTSGFISRFSMSPLVLFGVTAICVSSGTAPGIKAF